ncbi:hypothetical protein BSKO_02320 [Bryopsis sp. KO-2023]|nr:hypothetical protein BSKO_02320 [Bryopsis sp. KO-2023]
MDNSSQEEENMEGASTKRPRAIDNVMESEERSKRMRGAEPSNPEGGVDTDDEEHPASLQPRVRLGPECPYLDTINRQFLDFDFEKCCSVSLRPDNVYVCLVCGKYFQGRGKSTHAYTHALEDGHHMFMKLDTGRVFCLPDNYEVVDRSLDDIRYVLNPTFSKDDVKKLDVNVTWARALDGTEYMPGLVGLNNMKNNDYANVVIEILGRVTPVRDFFLIPDNYKHCKSDLVKRFGELLRKMWNTRNFKGQVSPHEFMQAVMKASNKKFTIEKQSDPVDFWVWFLNALHKDLTGGNIKSKSVITKCFQGRLEVITYPRSLGRSAANSNAMDVDGPSDAEGTKSTVPFLLIGLDLPPPPLFKDPQEKNIIPQVPIYTILRKFDGQSLNDDIKLGRRKFRLARLPKYLMLHMKRFTKNNFFVEKNPTIVNFPIKNLDLNAVIPVPLKKNGKNANARFDLVANVCHDGKANEGTYRVHVHRKVEDAWYELQDLRVVEVLPQIVSLSETYMQIYELRKD